MSEKSLTRLYPQDLGLKKRLFQLFSLYCVFIPVLSLFYKFSFEGRENVPKDEQIICAGNHISFFDPHLMAWATEKKYAYMAKKELFENPVLKFLLPKLGAFLVNHEKPDVSTIKTVRDIFKTNDWSLGIFPQGGIHRNKKVEEISRGFVALAKLFKKNILPIGITGTETNNFNPFKRQNVTVKIGKIISYELSEDEIIENWCGQLKELTGYEVVQRQPV